MALTPVNAPASAGGATKAGVGVSRAADYLASGVTDGGRRVAGAVERRPAVRRVRPVTAWEEGQVSSREPERMDVMISTRFSPAEAAELRAAAARADQPPPRSRKAA